MYKIENKNKIYSNSKLWLYENCPEFYKIKYIDKTLPEIPTSINAFLGSLVHESLEWLYKIKKERQAELDELVWHFINNWKKNIEECKINNKEKSEEFLNLGIKFLANYYEKNKPFTENTLYIEKKIFFPMDEYFITGYIDRIVLNEDEVYEVHDYKTNNFLKSQYEIDSDRQLAFYHLGLQELFGKEIKVKLIWHFLAHNKKITSTRTKEQLEELKIKTLNLIKKIESTQEWISCNRSWCEWCEYKRLNAIKNTEDFKKIKPPLKLRQSFLNKYVK